MDQAPPEGWNHRENALHRSFQRKDFVEALAFLIAVGKLAEAANHHPDVELSYNKLHLSLSTHDAGHKVTEKDIRLAEQINALSDATVLPAAQKLREYLRS